MASKAAFSCFVEINSWRGERRRRYGGLAELCSLWESDMIFLAEEGVRD